MGTKLNGTAVALDPAALLMLGDPSCTRGSCGGYSIIPFTFCARRGRPAQLSLAAY